MKKIKSFILVVYASMLLPLCHADSAISQARPALHAYITSMDLPTVSACNVNKGIISGCQTPSFIPGSDFTGPFGVAARDGYIYVTNSGNPSVNICQESINSGISGCTISYPSQSPLAITIAGKYAYMLNQHTNAITVCKVNDGGLSGCDTTPLEIDVLNPPTGISVSDGYVYIVNNGNPTIDICRVSGKAVLDCRISAPENMDKNAYEITVNDGYAYITNWFSNTISICKADKGSLSACQTVSQATGNFSVPSGVAINDGYIYITNQGNNTLSECKVNDGILSECNSYIPSSRNSPSLPVLSSPTGITISN